MTWFAVDDSFHGHPKLADLEQGKHFAEAIALWTISGSWCAAHLTDGWIPSAQFRRLVPFQVTKAAAELVRVGLWIESEGGYRFRDWNHYQPTKDEVESRREGSAARTRKSRQKAKEKSAASATDDVGNGACNALQERDQRASDTSVTLSRPDPSPVHSYECTSAPPRESPMDRMFASLSTTTAQAHEADAIVARFEAGWKRKAGSSLGVQPKRERERALALLAWAKSESADDPGAVVESAAEAAAADQEVRNSGSPWAWFCAKPGKYLAVARARTAQGGDEILRLADESNRLLNAANEALRAGNRNEHYRLVDESQKIAQKCEKLKKETGWKPQPKVAR